MKIVLSSCRSIGIYICLDMNLSDCEYVEDFLQLTKQSNALEIFPDRLNGSICMSGMWLILPNCTLLFQDRIGSKPDIVLTVEHMDEVDNFSYLDSGISPGGCISEEVSLCIQNG